MSEVAQLCPLFVTPWTVAYQAPPSLVFPRQEYWSGLPFPSPGVLPIPGIEPSSPALQAASLLSEPPGKPISKYVTESLTHVTGVNGALGLKWVTGQLVLKALTAQVRPSVQAELCPNNSDPQDLRV